MDLSPQKGNLIFQMIPGRGHPLPSKWKDVFASRLISSLEYDDYRPHAAFIDLTEKAIETNEEISAS